MGLVMLKEERNLGGYNTRWNEKKKIVEKTIFGNERTNLVVDF